MPLLGDIVRGRVRARDGRLACLVEDVRADIAAGRKPRRVRSDATLPRTASTRRAWKASLADRFAQGR